MNHLNKLPLIKNKLDVLIHINKKSLFLIHFYKVILVRVIVTEQSLKCKVLLNFLDTH